MTLPQGDVRDTADEEAGDRDRPRDTLRVPLEVLVTERRPVAEGVVELVLTRPDGADLPFTWTPGAHVDVEVAPDTVRQYSLCGDPADRTRLTIAVQVERDGRGGSRAVGEWRTGQAVTLHALRNTFPLEAGAGRHLVVAGGIGITPLVPMMRELHATGREFRLLYGARSEEAMAYRAELLAEFGDRVDLWPQDRRGLPDLASFLAGAGADDVVHACGPAGMLEAVEAACAGRPCALRTERFESAGTGPERGGAGFEVRLARSGITARVGPEESVLDVVRAAGARVLSSCQEGHCGTCETPVLSGRPDHRDQFLTEEEQASDGTMMICVSRCHSDVLELDL